MKFFLFFTLITILLSSCCKSEYRGELKFSKSDLQANPYSGIEDLRFVDDTGKVILFGNGRRNIVESEYFEHQGISCSDYCVVQAEDKTIFQSADPRSMITILIRNQTNPFNSERISPVLTINFIDQTVNPPFDYYFANVSVDSVMGDNTKGQPFYDSLTLGGRTFRNVYAFPGKYEYLDNSVRDTVFYSTAVGIIGFRFVNGKNWILQ